MMTISKYSGLHHTMQSNPPDPIETRLLALDTTIGQLDLSTAYLEPTAFGKGAKQMFDAHPLLPGILLLHNQQLQGMISRQQFFTRMSQPYSLELFLKRPIQAMQEFIVPEPLILPAETPINEAAQRSLQRTTDCLYEPIVVNQGAAGYALLDVHQLLLAQAEIHRLTTVSLQEKTQDYLYQTEKMSMLGQTIASVSHEIKNPVNCIAGNMDFLSGYVQTLVELLSLYRLELPHQSPTIRLFEEKNEVDFVLSDFPQMLESLTLASTRLVNLVSSIRNFSRIDREEREKVNLHTYLDGTLLILNSQIKQGIQVVKHYNDIPDGICYPGQISQVFMNLLSNSVDALLARQVQLADRHQAKLTTADGIEVTGQSWHPRIDVSTYVTEDREYIGISITDNGDGIPDHLQDKIFEPFFTTKTIDQGTGLGLAISQQIIANHGGRIQVDSDPGIGTTFEILLPLHIPIAKT